MTNILIDASHLMYRSGNVFASFCTSTKYRTGVQFGVMRALESLKRRYPGANIVFVRDGICHERQTILPAYKASRGESSTPEVYNPETLADVLTLIYASGCSAAYESDLECDDTIANIALDMDSAGMDVIIYSGDNDFHQLATERIKILAPSKPEDTLYSASDVANYWGVHPSGVALYRSFVGDSSDEIPKLPRVPKANLCSAINEGNKTTPEQFYEHGGLWHFNKDWQQRLYDFRSQCETNFKVTRLPFKRRSIEMERYHYDEVALTALFTKLEFKSFLKKMGALEILFRSQHEPFSA